MTPFELLLLLLTLTFGLVLADWVLRRRFQDRLAQLAREWRMHYVARDVFNLGDRVAHRFPVPGAANLRVTDVIYGVEGDFHRFIFCAEFTAGVVRSKQRVRRAASVRQPKGRTDPSIWPEIELADSTLALFEQYEELHRQQPPALAPGAASSRMEEQGTTPNSM